jgi:hypothetical protein
MLHAAFDRLTHGTPFGQAVLQTADLEALRAQLGDRFKG